MQIIKEMKIDMVRAVLRRWAAQTEPQRLQLTET